MLRIINNDVVVKRPQAGRAGQGRQVGQAGLAEQARQAGQAGQAGQGRQAGQAEQAERSPLILDYPKIAPPPPRRQCLRAHKETMIVLC